MRSLALCAACTAAVALFGCTTKPIPLSAQRGSTIVFPIAADQSYFRVGFSSDVLGYVDAQFGRTVFVPRNQAGAEFELNTRLVMRAWPDPASPAGIANFLPGSDGNFIGGQVFALIDIPPDIEVGTYAWTIRTKLPPKGGTSGSPYAGNFDPNTVPFPDEGDLFRDFAFPPTAGWPSTLGTFEVLANAADPNGLGASTPATGFFNNMTRNISDDLRELIPYYKVVLEFSDASYKRPAAADLVIAYPASKIEIKTVFEEHHLGRGSTVRWSTDVDGGSGLDVVRIQFVDPDRSVWRLAIAFDLIQQPAGGVLPIVLSDFGGLFGGAGGFEILSERQYDENGVLITDPSYGLQLAGVW